MIYDKELLSPALKRRSVKRELSLFREKSGALLCRGLNFREEDGAIVCGEGTEKISVLPEGTVKLIASKGHRMEAYAYTSAGSLISLNGGNSYSGVPSPKAVIAYTAESGEELLFILTESALYRLTGGSAVAVSGAKGGTDGCIFCERLLTADGCSVRWSKPLSPVAWEDGLQEAGYVELPSSSGNILAVIPLKDCVYLFRERGITALRMSGDTLAFKSEETVVCGKIISGSIALCGEEVLFAAESGIYLFDGRLQKLDGCGFSEVGLLKESAGGDKYYASVVLKDGEDALWVVDPTEKRGHFLRIRAETLTCTDELLYAEEGKLCRLIGHGMPAYGRRECVLKTEHSLLGLSARKKYLDSISLEGTGRFCVEARAEKGAPRAAVGEAGERLVLPAPVRGTSFSLDIRTLSERAKLKSITFDLREESETW